MENLSENAIEGLYNTAYTFFRQGKYERATHFFRLLSIAAPEESRSWFGLASSLQMETKYREALEAFVLADAYHEGEDPRIPFHAAECYMSRGEEKQAQKALQVAKHRAQQSNNTLLLDRITVYENRRNEPCLSKK